MAVVDNRATSSAFPKTMARTAATVASFIARICEFYRLRQAVRELEQADDGLLRDLGIHRSEIRSVVYGKPHERMRRYVGR